MKRKKLYGFIVVDKEGELKYGITLTSTNNIGLNRRYITIFESPDAEYEYYDKIKKRIPNLYKADHKIIFIRISRTIPKFFISINLKRYYDSKYFTKVAEIKKMDLVEQRKLKLNIINGIK